MKKMKKVLAILLSVVLVASIFCGCQKTELTKTNAQTETKTEVQNETKSEESKVIMRTGELTTMQPFPNTDNENTEYPMYYYDDLNSMILAYQAGKIDSLFLLPDIVAEYVENYVDGVKAVEPTSYTGTMGLCIGTLKENIETYNILNNAIDKLTNNGTIKKLKDEYLDKYIRTKEEPKAIDIQKIDGAKTLKIAITGDMPPIDFITTDGKPAGFNVALLSEISKIANVNFELVQVNSGARRTALKTNTVDAVFHNISIKYDNEKLNEYAYEDLPDEISITKPYYTSRIFEVDSIKRMDELVAKGLISSQEKVQNDDALIAGEFPYASRTEEEENDKIKRTGWSMSVKYFDNLNQMMLAMKSGQIDYISSLPKSTAEYIKERNEDIVLYKSRASDDDRVEYSMATLEDNKEAYNLFNDTLNEIIKDGMIKDIEKKYIDEFIEDKDNPRAIDMPHFDDAKTIKVAVTGNLPPLDFVSSDGEPAGYNIALLSEIAKRAKINIELVTMDEAAKVTALATKNIDVIFWLSSIKCNDERNTLYDCPKGVILTDSYFEDELYLVCPKGGKADKRFSANNDVKNTESKVKMRTGELARMVTEGNNDEEYPVTLFDDLNSMIMAFNANKVDSMYGLPDVVSKYISNQIDGTEVVLPTDYLGTLNLCMAVLKENNETLNLLNDAIDKFTNDGTLKRLKNEYINKCLETGKDPENIDLPHFDNARTIRVAVTGNLPPIDYVTLDGTSAGFAVALLSEIAKCENINIELVNVNDDTRLIALKTGTADAVFYATKYSYDDNKYKLAENVDISDDIAITKPYYTSRVTKVVHSKLAEELGLTIVQNEE